MFYALPCTHLRLVGCDSGIFGLPALRHIDVRSAGKKETCKLPSELSSVMPNVVIRGGTTGKKKKGKGKKKGGKKKKK